MIPRCDGQENIIMTSPASPPETGLRRFLRPRPLIISAVAIIVLALLLKGLLTPAPTATSNARATPGSAAPIVGHYAPKITAVDLSGNTVTLASLRGKAIALNFWYAACEPCKIEMPALQRSYDKYKGDGFVVLGIDVTDNAATTSAFIKSVGVTYPIVRDQALQTVTAYNVTDTPSTFFIDRDGVIRTKVVGALDLSTLDSNIHLLLK
jgi:cytochrome c biogenesis protein CcmG/thiol:disulfide interchange protein DsbE